MNHTMTHISVLVFAVTLAVAAFAGSKSQDITLYRDAQVNGTTLPAGEYTVKYDVNGSNAQVRFLKGKKEIANATGQLKELSSKPAHNEVVLQNGGGTPSVSELHFGGNKMGIALSTESANTGK